MSVPFIIYALPRSRTAWLSIFLSYKDWVCGHELAMHMRSMAQVKSVFSRPNTGTAETGAAYGRPLIKHVMPNIKEVIVLRPVEEVIESLMKIDLSGVGYYPPEALRKVIEYGDRVLRKIAQEKNVLTVNFADLERKETCAKIFEHCLPYPFDKVWWESLRRENIQIDSRELLRYRLANRPAIDAFKRHCKTELSRLCRVGEIPLRRAA
jgi:hypothetical protein